VRLQERRSKFLITKVVHKVSDDLEESSSAGIGLSSSVSAMIESEEKGKEARKQKRIEEQDRREYVVYSFDEHQGFYRQEMLPRPTGTEAAGGEGTGGGKETENPLAIESLQQMPTEDEDDETSAAATEVATSTATVSLRECMESADPEDGLSLKISKKRKEENSAEDLAEDPVPGAQPATEAAARGRGGGISQQESPRLPQFNRPAPFTSSKSQSLKASRGENGIRKKPIRSVSLKNFKGIDSTEDNGEGKGERGTGPGGQGKGGGIVYWEDGEGSVGAVKYHQNVIRIDSYNEEERADEEKMIAEDRSLMDVAEE
jgi:hypothetical protein